MGAEDGAQYRKAQPDPADVAGARAFKPDERVEDMIERVGRDAGAVVVVDKNLDGTGGLSQRDMRPPLLRREALPDQPDHLAPAFPVWRRLQQSGGQRFAVHHGN